MVVAVAESSPWFFSFHGKGDDFCEMVCPRRDGWEGPGRYSARCGGDMGTTSAADATLSPPPRTRARIRSAGSSRISTPGVVRGSLLFPHGSSASYLVDRARSRRLASANATIKYGESPVGLG